MARPRQNIGSTKKCTKCGKTKKINEFYYHRLRKLYMASCKECNSKQCVSYGKNKRKNKDYEFILRSRAAHIKRECKHKNIKYDKNLSNILVNLWESQDKKCFYTGKPMELNGYHKNNPLSVTVDRKIPERGYVDGNIVLCCSVINRMKQNLTIKEMFAWVEDVKKYYEL